VEETVCLDATSVAHSGVLDPDHDLILNALTGVEWVTNWFDRGPFPEEFRLLNYKARPDGSGGSVLSLTYSTRWGVSNEQLPLVTTRPHFGGRRWWFRCPSCHDLAARLYRPRASRWLCRSCHGLTYRSTQEHDARIDTPLQNPDVLEDLMRKIQAGVALTSRERLQAATALGRRRRQKLRRWSRRCWRQRKQALRRFVPANQRVPR
jgi:hypothetical protein